MSQYIKIKISITYTLIKYKLIFRILKYKKKKKNDDNNINFKKNTKHIKNYIK